MRLSNPGPRLPTMSLIGFLPGLRMRSSDGGNSSPRTVFDAGAATIHYHLGLELDVVPSVSTIWRVLKRGGFVTPQPHKRPKSSWIRFEAQLPNECWQADVTHWQLADGSEVEICNMIDDYSRVALGAEPSGSPQPGP
jgi:transposase InsO family protein